MPTKIDNQDLEHQREKTLVNDEGVKVTPHSPRERAAEKELRREDRKAEEAVRKFEEALTRLPPG